MTVKKPKVVSLVVGWVKGRNPTKKHRKCVLQVPKIYADVYEEGQMFQVVQGQQNQLIYWPVELKLPDMVEGTSNER